MNALFVQVLRLGLNAVPVILIVLLARLLLRRAPKRCMKRSVAARRSTVRLSSASFIRGSICRLG